MRRSYLVLLLKTRSLLLSLLTVIPLVVVILGLTACVKHPVGDPEQSRVDPQFASVWLTEESGGGGTFLFMRPYDSRTYLVNILSYDTTNGGIQPRDQMQCKAWLTSIGGATFLTMEPLSGSHFAGLSEQPPYLIGKVNLVGGALHLRLVDGDREAARGAGNRQELEAAIAKHVDAASLYVDETTVFAKTTDKARIEAILKLFHHQD